MFIFNIYYKHTEKMKLNKIKETKYYDVYKIEDEYLYVNNIKIDLMSCTAYSTLSHYLNKNGTTLNNYIINVINGDICNICDTKINKSKFSRKVFKNYKYCNDCIKDIKIKDKLEKKIQLENLIKECIICKKNIKTKDSIYSTCGDDKCMKEYRKKINENIKRTHWTKRKDYDIIKDKRIKKRKQNDILLNRKYVAWNKGKTGIYSKETIEKIRNAAIRQMKEGRIKKTGQEKIFEEFLIKNNIKYTYSFIYKRRQYDFLIHDYKLVVELHGDYWHGNPKFWDTENNDNNKKKLYETQIMKKKDDIIKKQIIDESMYDFVEFWEYDIHNNFTEVENILINEFKIKINK